MRRTKWGLRDGAVGVVVAAVMALACSSVAWAAASPAFAGDFPDPSVIVVNGRYFAFSTQVWDGTRSRWTNVQELQSADGRTWTLATVTSAAGADALPNLPRWAVAGNTWAPAVIQVGSTFVMYYTATNASNGLQCVSRAKSSTAQGPYSDSSSSPLVCQTARGGSIDANPFRSPSGALYLHWKSDDNRNGRPTSLWAQPLNSDGLSFPKRSTATQLLTADASWENGVIEGPSMTAVATGAGVKYFLFYGASYWDDASAGIGYATCSGPTGPCTKATKAGPWLTTGAAGVSAIGPSGPTFYVAPGVSPFDPRQNLAYHGWYGGSAPGYNNGSVRALWRDTVDFSTGSPTLVSS